MRKTIMFIALVCVFVLLIVAACVPRGQKPASKLDAVQPSTPTEAIENAGDVDVLGEELSAEETSSAADELEKISW